MLVKLFKALTRKGLRSNSKEGLKGKELKNVLASCMYAEQQGAYLNSYTTGLSKKEIKTLLQKYWGISNDEEAHATLDYLAEGNYSRLFPVVIEMLQTIEGDYSSIAERKVLDVDMEMTIKMFRNLRDNVSAIYESKIASNLQEIEQIGVSSWDFGRAAFIARLCFDMNYITLDKLKSYLDNNYSQLLSYCKDWKQMCSSYVIGRVCWSGSTGYFESLIPDLLEKKNSPLRGTSLT